MKGQPENTARLWAQIEDVFHQAMLVPEAEREAVLRQLCHGNEPLLNEVRSLLQSHESSVDFLEGWQPHDADLLLDAFRGWRSAASAPEGASQKQDEGRDFAAKVHSAADRPLDVPASPSQVPTVRLGSAELDDLAGQLVALRPEFTVQDVVGRGGVGIVLRVFDQRLCRTLAVKLLWPKVTRQPPRSASENAQQMEREARAAAAVVNEHTVRVYEAGLLPSGIAYLVLEWVAGPTLFQVLQSHGLLPAQSAAEVTRQVCLGLAAAHRVGLVHSDVKPANVLLQPIEGSAAGLTSDVPAEMDWRAELSLDQWRVKLTDFGLASLRGDQSPGGAAPGGAAPESAGSPSPVPANPGFSGTLAYASPDRVWKRQPLSPQDDVWSVGITLYQLLTGSLPFRGAPHALARALRDGEVVRPTILEPSIPKDLESICLKALSKHRDQRYANGQEMAEDLMRFLTGRPTLARPLPQWQSAYRWMKRNRQLSALAAALLVALTTLCLGALVSRQILATQNHQLRHEQEQAERARLQQILVASPVNLKTLLDSTQLRRELAEPILRSSLRQPDMDEQAKLNALVALSEISPLNEAEWDLLVSAVTQATVQPSQCENLLRALAKERSRALHRLDQVLPTLSESRQHIRAAIVAAHLGNGKWLERIAAHRTQPHVRTELIHFWPKFHGPIREMQAWLHDGASTDVQYAVCLAIALFDPDSFPPMTAGQVVAELQALQARTDDSGVRAAAEIARRTWAPLRSQGTVRRNVSERNPSAIPNDLRLIKIPAGRHLLGRINPDVLHDDHQPHWVTLTRDYWMADREVSIQWYQAFLDDDQYPADQKPLPNRRQAPDQATSPTPAHPVQRVSWNDAAMFCNWLSWRESLSPRYKFSRVEFENDDPEGSGRGTSQTESGQRPPVISDEWEVTIDPAADGYRLPTLAEWEVACRAGAESDFFYGDDFELFGYYGRFSSSRVVATAACGTLFPNRYGLHETLGNVWEWCEDWYQPIGTQPLTDPSGPPEPWEGLVGRTFAGGGVQTSSGEPIAGARGFTSVDGRYANLGFRVARSDSAERNQVQEPKLSANGPNSPR